MKRIMKYIKIFSMTKKVKMGKKSIVLFAENLV